MMHDPIADMFIRIKNAQAAHHATVTMPASKVKENIARVLLENKFIESVTRKQDKPGDILEITLRYEGKTPGISRLDRISKPGLRRFSNSARIPRPFSGHGLVIMSTPKGIMSGWKAQQEKLGGEVIATVW